MTQGKPHIIELKRYGSFVARAELLEKVNLTNWRHLKDQLEHWSKNGKEELVIRYKERKKRHFLPRVLAIDFIRAIEGNEVEIKFT